MSAKFDIWMLWNKLTIFQCLVGGLKQKALLGVETLGLSRLDGEKGGVEPGWVICEEVTTFAHDLGCVSDGV
jgi:hypothetical protein